jgi:hypothetical protein
MSTISTISSAINAKFVQAQLLAIADADYVALVGSRVCEGEAPLKLPAAWSNTKYPYVGHRGLTEIKGFYDLSDQGDKVLSAWAYEIRVYDTGYAHKRAREVYHYIVKRLNKLHDVLTEGGKINAFFEEQELPPSKKPLEGSEIEYSIGGIWQIRCQKDESL